MDNIKRTIQADIIQNFFKGKAIVIYGARQVGKTTLIKDIQKQYLDSSVYLNCDEPDIRAVLTNATSTALGAYIGDKRIVFLDEAQRVKNIGITLKLIVDNFSDVQVVATGSSSFDLSNEISEPLTGRKREYQLFPLSIGELMAGQSWMEKKRLLELRMVYGMYPEICRKNAEDAVEVLKEITRSYLFKDILQFHDIKYPEILEKLLQSLALQIGHEVSYTELAGHLGIDKVTVSNYIQLLEKGFVIFRLRPFQRNLRNELKKLRKIFFVDLGIRNALINNFNPLDLRQDAGFLWENFMISERIKYHYHYRNHIQWYFWRTHQQQEIDYIEDVQGVLFGFEFKWRDQKYRPPKAFLSSYPGSSVQLITQDTVQDFIP